MRRIAMALAVAVVPFPLSAHAPAGHEAGQAALPQSARSAAATVDAFHDALRRGDTKAAALLLAEDAVVFEEGGVERSKAEYAGSHLPADAAFSQVVSATVTRRSGGSDGTLAWIASEGRMTGAYKGKAVDRVTTETMLLRRVGPTWKVVHIHWSSAAAHD
jgi:ketosteroid isomerase-like protein